MCTVSLIETGGLLRLVANRDEQRSRARALPPRIVELDGVSAVVPIDPLSGGTWIAANEHGLAVALLNLNPPSWKSQFLPPRSRGEIVPRLAACATIEAALALARALDVENYAPFRLVCATRFSAAEIIPAAGLARQFPVNRPLMFTSSGLGDEQVETPRRELFGKIVTAADPAMQDRFHSHEWSDRRHLSVMMSREDACTVSRTTVELGPDRLMLVYSSLPDGETVSAVLPIDVLGRGAASSR